METNDLGNDDAGVTISSMSLAVDQAAATNLESYLPQELCGLEK
jgi:hypothetical protein